VIDTLKLLEFQAHLKFHRHFRLQRHISIGIGTALLFASDRQHSALLNFKDNILRP